MKHAILAVIAGGWLLAAPAQAEELVVDQKVDATAVDPAQARALAITQGQEAAYFQWLRASNPAITSLAQAGMTPEKISALVRKYEIMEEKPAGNRYAATVRYTFSTSGVGTNPVINTEEVKNLGDTSLILPVWWEKSTPALWEAQNLTRHVWSQASLLASKHKIVLPLGDATDIDIVDAVGATTASFYRMLPMLKRYGAGEVLVVQMKPEEQEGKPLAMAVMMRILSAQKDATFTAAYQAEAGEGKEALIARIVGDIRTRLEKGAARNFTDLGVKTPDVVTLEVTAEIQDVVTWADLRARLRRIREITEIQPVSLSQKEVQFRMSVKGSPENLVQNLKDQNVVMVKGQKTWVMRPE